MIIHGMCIDLHRFIKKSNEIERIYKDDVDEEVAATEEFINTETLSIRDLEALVSVYQPDAVFRSRPGANVFVGNYKPPAGGIIVITQTQELLTKINVSEITPYHAHCRYETIHPFTDGNGRSGRALWLWLMLKKKDPWAQLDFLNAFYYQSLEASRK